MVGGQRQYFEECHIAQTFFIGNDGNNWNFTIVQSRVVLVGRGRMVYDSEIGKSGYKSSHFIKP